MTKRREDEAGDGHFTNQFPAVVADDDFLTAISQGGRPEEEGELADLLLGFREEIVEAPMPPAPTLAELGLGGGTEEPDTAQVIPMRPRRAGFGRSLVSGLVGAAAATLLIAGGGAAIYNASPGSPLWGMSKTMFGDRAAVVELAGTLDEMDGFAETGDVEGMRALLADARAQLSTRDGRAITAPTPETVTSTVTVELEPRTTTAPTPESREPERGETETTTVQETIVEEQTLTETVVQTVTVTVRPQQPPVVEPTPVAPVPTVTAEPGTPAPTEAENGAPENRGR